MIAAAQPVGPVRRRQAGAGVVQLFMSTGGGDMYRSPERSAARIRQDQQADPGLTVSELAQRHRVSRRIVEEALGREPAPPPARHRAPRLMDPVAGFLDEILRREARGEEAAHSIRRILQRLADEAEFTAASHSTVRDHVRRRRQEIQAETAGNTSPRTSHDSSHG
ncbi:hypothetical protein ABII15_00400 [Streptomyces sp. HUAS MG91]|uniref:Transposase n=1 Tax=Streptomyces tabacisoli TaxID=3156398 RepID=A0AAU8IK01_9ACTN